DLGERDVPRREFLGRHHLAARRRQALAGEVVGIRPVPHVVGFGNDERPILLGQGLREGRPARRLNVAHLLNVGHAPGQAERAKDHDPTQSHWRSPSLRQVAACRRLYVGSPPRSRSGPSGYFRKYWSQSPSFLMPPFPEQLLSKAELDSNLQPARV